MSRTGPALEIPLRRGAEHTNSEPPMKVLVSWSGGKDSALALAAVAADRRYQVAGLLTTLSAEFDRVSMHGVRRELLERQTRALGLPLVPVVVEAARADQGESYLSFPTNNTYEQAMGAALMAARQRGIEGVVFGDLHLEDLRAYRDQLLSSAGLRGVYPLWQESPTEILSRFVASGFEAVIVCVDGRRLGAEWLGRRLDAAFRAELPPEVDPCGENGEYHTFVVNGPGFHEPVSVAAGPRVWREPFWFLDLLPADEGQ